MRLIPVVVVLLQQVTGCKRLREPVRAEARDVTVEVSETDDDKLAIRIHNGRAERISKTTSVLGLYMVDGVPTLDLGPRERYRRGWTHVPCAKELEGIDPGQDWSVEAAFPTGEQTPDLDPAAPTADGRQSAPTSISSLRLRVWVFPHIGLENNCAEKWQILPELFIEDRSGSAVGPRRRVEDGRSFVPTEEYGLFRARLVGPAAESILYFIEAKLELSRSIDVSLLADRPR